VPNSKTESDWYFPESFQISNFLFIVLVPCTEDGYSSFQPDSFFLPCVFLFIKSYKIILLFICHCKIVLRKQLNGPVVKIKYIS